MGERIESSDTWVRLGISLLEMRAYAAGFEHGLTSVAKIARRGERQWPQVGEAYSGERPASTMNYMDSMLTASLGGMTARNPMNGMPDDWILTLENAEVGPEAISARGVRPKD